MRIILLLCLALLVSAPVYSDILHGVDTVGNDTGITFNPHVTTALGKVPLGSYTCTTTTPPIDIFVNDYQLSSCSHPCPHLLIGSPRPFFVSKKDIDSIDLSKALSINDTSQFVKIDSSSFSNPSIACVLPILPDQTFMPDSINVMKPLIIKCYNNVYAIILVSRVIINSVYYDPMPHSYSYLSRYIFYWYIQNNGSLIFNTQITKVANQIAAVKKKEAPTLNRSFFSIKGKKISPNAKFCKNSAAFILQANGRLERFINLQ